MSTAENKAVLRHLADEFNKRNLAVVEEVFSSTFVLHDANQPHWPRGLEGARRMFTVMLTAVPDLQITMEDCIAEGRGAVDLSEYEHEPLRDRRRATGRANDRAGDRHLSTRGRQNRGRLGDGGPLRDVDAMGVRQQNEGTIATRGSLGCRDLSLFINMSPARRSRRLLIAALSSGAAL
jgi:SnoaL-like protein